MCSLVVASGCAQSVYNYFKSLKGLEEMEVPSIVKTQKCKGRDVRLQNTTV